MNFKVGFDSATAACCTMALAFVLASPSRSYAQPPTAHYGDLVPRDVREMYDRGLQYLANTQAEAGNWNGGDPGPGPEKDPSRHVLPHRIPQRPILHP